MSTHDVVIRNGLVYDGSGAAPRHADVGISGGRVTAVADRGEIVAGPAREIDASDLAVSPGFVDIHTHFDAQPFWDTTLSPSPLHGVTSVFGGNCGFTLAPLRNDMGDYLLRMLARVEGMPLSALQSAVPCDWTTMAEFLDRLDGTLAINAGFLVGHCALRCTAMGPAATEREATTDEIATMQRLLAESLRAGGMGFSSTWGESHNDHNGRPVPSRRAGRDELLALCSTVREHPGTTLEFLPGIHMFPQERFDLMAEMSRAADRSVNWNLLQVSTSNRETAEYQLRGTERANALGGRVYVLSLPDMLRARFNFRTGFALDTLPGWGPLMALPLEEKLAMLRDPQQRRHMDELAHSSPAPALQARADWQVYTLLETFSDSTKAYEGRRVGDVAAESGRSAWDTLADILIADDLRTVIATPDDLGQDDASWAWRARLWEHPNVVIGGSDAGAHLDMTESFCYSTQLLQRGVRERALLPLEKAVNLITQVPARLYGLRDRGILAEGAHADVVLFDPDRVGPEAMRTRYDLPGGAGRIYAAALGVDRVLVGGVEVVHDGEFTGERPGRVLRSGRDTETPAPAVS